MLADLVGERGNRRHRPGRGWEAVRYRFEIVSDYGGFRDMQRHRMLTCQWQSLGPDLGAGVPEEVVEAGAGDEYARALEISRTEFDRLEDAGMPEAAPYALCLGYRIRYVLDMNAREAMHVCELRSGREGHPTYRAVAQAMHEQISAVHPGDRRRDAPRRLELRAAPGADHERDPHPPQARRRWPHRSGAARARRVPAAAARRFRRLARSCRACLAVVGAGRGRRGTPGSSVTAVAGHGDERPVADDPAAAAGAGGHVAARS